MDNSVEARLIYVLQWNIFLGIHDFSFWIWILIRLVLRRVLSRLLFVASVVVVVVGIWLALDVVLGVYNLLEKKKKTKRLMMTKRSRTWKKWRKKRHTGDVRAVISLPSVGWWWHVILHDMVYNNAHQRVQPPRWSKASPSRLRRINKSSKTRAPNARKTCYTKLLPHHFSHTRIRFFLFRLSLLSFNVSTDVNKWNE